MPEKMLFGEVVEENGVPLVAKIKRPGAYDRGKWVEGRPEDVPFTGVVLPLAGAGSQSNIGELLTYAENGTYLLKAKKLLTVQELPKGTEIIYKNEPYTVQSFKDLTDYTDVHIYLMRYREKGVTT